MKRATKTNARKALKKVAKRKKPKPTYDLAVEEKVVPMPVMPSTSDYFGEASDLAYPTTPVIPTWAYIVAGLVAGAIVVYALIW